MFLSNLDLTVPQIDQKESEFQQVLLNIDQIDEVYEELRDFFSKISKEDIKKYQYSYWRWYTFLTWNRLNSLSKDDFLNTAINEQIPMALLLDFDILRSLMWYFVANNFIENDLESFYIQVKKTFLQSDSVLGMWKGEDVIVSEVVKEVSTVYGKNDSLLEADFENRLQQVIFPFDEVSKKYFTIDPERAKERFLDLVVFFQTITQENIWSVVDAFISPEKYRNGAFTGESVSAAVPAKESVQPEVVEPIKPEPKITEKKEVKETIELIKPIPEQTPTIEPQVRLTMGQIKSQIEAKFKKDTEGNFVDLEGVMAELNSLAEKYNDPKIAEMIYFDETNNKFSWNI